MAILMCLHRQCVCYMFPIDSEDSIGSDGLDLVCSHCYEPLSDVEEELL